MEVNLSLTALGVVSITYTLCVLVILGNARACFTPEVCLGNDPDFLPLESVDYCTLALPPHAGIKGVTWQILHPIANTLPLLAAFNVSFRPSSCWPRGLTNRVGLDEAPLFCARRAITVWIQLTAHTYVTLKGFLCSPCHFATAHRGSSLLRGLF